MIENKLTNLCMVGFILITPHYSCSSSGSLQEEEFDNQQFSQQQFDQQQQGQFANQQSQQGFADSDQQSSNENNLAGLENNEFNQVSDQNIENLGFEEESFAGDGDFLPEQNMENQGFDQISEEDIAELAFENNQSYGNQSAVANGLGPNFDDDLEDGLGGNNQLLNDDELLDNPFSNEVNVVGDNNTGANENNFDPGSDNQNSIASGGSGSGFLRWIGYKYKNKLEVYLRFKGAKIPAYEFLQIKNRKGQPELVVRFPGSKRWHEMRRDLVAEEFFAPVGYVRMKESDDALDVVLTLRDVQRPSVRINGSEMRLSYDLPREYVQANWSAVEARRPLLASANISPREILGDVASQLNPVVQSENEFDGRDAFGGDDNSPADVNVLNATQENSLLDSTQGEDDASLFGGNDIRNEQESNALGLDEDNQELFGNQGQNYNNQALLGDQNDDLFGNDFEDDLFNNNNGNTGSPGSASPATNASDAFEEVSPNPFGNPNGSNSPDAPDLNPDDFQFQNDDLLESDEPAYDFDVRIEQQFVGNMVAASDGLDKALDGFDDADLSSEELKMDGLDESAEMKKNMASEEPAAPPVILGSAAGGVNAGFDDIGLNAKMDLDFRGAPLYEVVRAISEENSINFTFPPSLGNTSIYTNFKGVTGGTALKAILESNGLGMVRVTPNMIRIDTLSKLADESTALIRAKQSAERLIDTQILIIRLSYAQATDVVGTVQAIVSENTSSQNNSGSRTQIQADTRTNSVIVEAIPSVLRKVRAIIEKLDLQTPQVEIRTRLVELQAEMKREFGISWIGALNLDASNGLGFGTLTFPNSIRSDYAIDTGSASSSASRLGMQIGSINPGINVDAILGFEESRDRTKILQTNRIVTQDNQTGRIVEGSSDFFTGSSDGVTINQGEGGSTSETQISSIEYDYTVEVTPHITADSSVQMDLSINSEVPKEAAEGADAGSTRREITTTVLSKSGETTVIGGVWDATMQRLKVGVPVLSWLPLIGPLFRRSLVKERQTEILMMVTPTIMNQSPLVARKASFDMADDFLNEGFQSQTTSNREVAAPPTSTLLDKKALNRELKDFEDELQ